jgi:glyoxylase-like metal-dependent hydrolase (beta-lactamase superfamily II)
MLNKKIRKNSTPIYALAEDVACRRVLYVNHYFIGNPGEGNPWVLVDAGLPGAAKRILKDAEELFGNRNPPLAIILTHGHFDHIGTLPDLLKIWPKVKVYVHPLEIPFLTGRARYPNSALEGSKITLSYMKWFFIERPIDLGNRVYPLPVDGSIPFLKEWIYIHTPGHSPGHISLYRKKDGVLIAGDAFTTTNQDALSSVLLQKKEINGPPSYLTINWRDALKSIRKIVKLNPTIAGTGHGLPLKGEELTGALSDLSENFLDREIPNSMTKTKIVKQRGPLRFPWKATLAVSGLALVAGGAYLKKKKKASTTE